MQRCSVIPPLSRKSRLKREAKVTHYFVNFIVSFNPNHIGALLGMTRGWVWVRSPASTLRRRSRKSLKHRTREEGAGKGEFAFTECTNQFRNLAQNRGFCAKEEPQALKADKAGYTCLVAKSALRRRRLHYFPSLRGADNRKHLHFLARGGVDVHKVLSALQSAEEFIAQHLVAFQGN